MSAAPRKSASKTAARERARSAAAAALEKENRLLDAAEGFFLATASTDRKKEQLRDKIAKLNDELASLDSPSIEGARLVSAMKDEGLSNKEVAQRLEISSAEVSGYLRTVRDSAPEKRSGDDASASDSEPTDSGSEESALVSGESEQ